MKINNLNLFGLIYSRWKFGNFSILPHRNVHMHIASGARAGGGGRLILGEQWSSELYLPSQMVMRKNSELVVHGLFKIYSGHNISVNENATLILGSGYINNGLNMACFDRIEIGTDVAISENVTIRDSDNHRLNGSEPTKPIKIGNKVWIGLNVTILKGVTIGNGAVIAAGSLVNKDVPPRSLVAGVPAIVRKKDIEWT